VMSEGDYYVFYISATFKLEKEARTWVSQTHEHKERTEGPCPPPRKRPRSAGSLAFQFQMPLMGWIRRLA
jgi:hypothetical protein